MKTILAILCTSLALTAPAAFAQAPGVVPSAAPSAVAVNPATLAASRAMLESMNYRAVVQGMLGQMRQSIMPMMQQGAAAAINGNAKLSDAQKKEALAKMAQSMPQAMRLVEGVFADGKLVDEMLAETESLYARHFTADELAQMTAFNKTPVGAKMIATMPQLMNESMVASQRVVLPRITAIVQNLTQLK